ncbi:MAG: HesA/MoeB/ThiF family protein [Candidatus Thermoplasmatota archaeon]
MSKTHPLKKDATFLRAGIVRFKKSVISRLTERERERYKRQIIIPGFGIGGQKKLKETHITVVGAGGLGSAVSTYLATAGIGKLSMIDNDRVELGNLNRQILHWEKDLGKNKATSAVEKLKQINTDIKIIGSEETINEKNALDLIKGCNGIVDCLDNFYTRYILNDVALKLNLPLFHAACQGWGGQVTTIIPKKTACLKCVFPKAPPKEDVPILGAVAGTIGTIQATEVIKYLVGIEPLLTNKLLIYDANFLTYDLIMLKRKKNCPSCGK